MGNDRYMVTHRRPQDAKLADVQLCNLYEYMVFGWVFSSNFSGCDAFDDRHDDAMVRLGGRRLKHGERVTVWRQVTAGCSHKSY